MPEFSDELLAQHTTMRVGGPARRYVIATTEAELLSAIREADECGEPVLILGGGSNLVIGDAGFPGLVVQVATSGITQETCTPCAGVFVRVAAGENWDRFVEYAVNQGWSGVETLSGIPGCVGSTPIQNVGAYGADVSQTIARVRAYDRQLRQITTFEAAECGFSYRDSRFKWSLGRYVVLDVWFQLQRDELSRDIAYPELARELGVELGQAAPLRETRAAVLTIRGRKGMVLDEFDHDTWSAGSFFTNPIISVGNSLPEAAPRFAIPGRDDVIKTSAAWLIEQAGFGKGYGLNDRATLSTKHCLALTNRGSATAADIMELRDEIIDGVEQVFGITLVPEPVIVAGD
ncbi:MAG: UDP-N-acetylmuramate dehydrogenase [Propionibacteriaceae bacterium]